jgi:hypothetical protein
MWYNNHVSNTTLSNHIAALNAKTQAWIDEAPGRGAGLYTTDIGYWNSCGVYTPEDFDRYELENTIWDVYKEVHGVRPRGLGLKDMSIAELQMFLNNLNTQH